MPSSYPGPSSVGIYACDQCEVKIDTFVSHNVIQSGVAPNRKTIRKIGISVETFVGRGEEIKKIQSHFSALTDGNANPLNRMLVITGSAGMGKSELAKKFAETYAKEYPNVVFLNSEKKESLEASFTELAIELGLTKESTKEQKFTKTKPHANVITLLPKIYKALSEGYGRTLFIFDNAVALESSDKKFNLKDYLPQSGYFPMPMFLLTSRNPQFWEHHVEPSKIFPLSLLPQEETQKFLLSMTPLDEVTPHVEELLQKISSILGGYPLGLKLASEIKAIGADGRSNKAERTKQRLKGLLKILENVNNKIHSHNLKGEERQLEMLRALFEAKIETISTENEDAVRLLGIISFMNVDCIFPHVCYLIFYRSPSPLDPYEYKKNIKKDAFETAIKKLQDHNIIDLEQSSLPWQWNIKIHRQLQKLTKMRLASLRDISILEEIALWCESAKYCNGTRLSYFSNILEDLFDIFKPSHKAQIVEAYFRFYQIFVLNDLFRKEYMDEKCVILEQNLASKIHWYNIVSMAKELFGRNKATINQVKPPTDLRNILEMDKMVRKRKHSKVVQLMKKSLPKLQAVVDNTKLYDEIWKFHFCIKCCDFLSREQAELILVQLLHKMAEEIQIIPNDLITESILRVMGECWKRLEGSDISIQEDCAKCIALILINLEPHTLVYNVWQFWLEIQKLVGKPQNIFEQIFHSNEKEAWLKSKEFLEVWKHHTQIMLSHDFGYGAYRPADLHGMVILFWTDLEATAQPSSSVLPLIEHTLMDWLENSGRFFWLHDYNQKYKFKGKRVRMRINKFLEDPKVNEFSPTMKSSLEWILITAPSLNDEYYTACNRYMDCNSSELALFKTEFSRRIDSVKQHETGDGAWEILKIVSFFTPETIYFQLARIFKSFPSGLEALNLLQSQSIIAYGINKMSGDWIMVAPIVFEILWGHMGQDERISLVDKVSELFVENIEVSLDLNEFVMEKANCWVNCLNTEDQTMWLRLLLCNCLTNNDMGEELYKSLHSKIQMTTTKDPAYDYALICPFLTKYVDATRSRVITVSEREILGALDALLEDDKVSRANWHVHIILMILPMLEKSNAEVTFEKVICWVKKFANEFMGEISFEGSEKKLKYRWRIAESYKISLTIQGFSGLISPLSQVCMTLKFILALFNFHGINGLCEFWICFREILKNVEVSFRLSIFTEFFIENLKLLRGYNPNDEVGRLFDVMVKFTLPDVLKFCIEPDEIIEYKRVLESLEDYAEHKFLHVINGEKVHRMMGSFILIWLRILLRLIISSSSSLSTEDLCHAKRFSQMFVAFSNGTTRPMYEIVWEESDNFWLQVIADGEKLRKQLTW